MSETLEPTPKAVTPAVLVGAASPLWGYFAGAAAGGVALWWMTRWAHPENLEALFAAAAPTLGTEAEPEIPFVPMAQAGMSEASGSGADAPPLEIEGAGVESGAA